MRAFFINRQPYVDSMPRIILHVDMDSFFTAVEMRGKPELKGKPVVVGADPKEGKGRGVVSTCSYEARKFGIKSAMPISQAYRLCPNAVFLPVNMPLYAAASEQIMQNLRLLCGKFQQVSIDEAFLDVSSRAGDFEEAKRLAASIQKDVLDKEKLSCSIGIGPNKLIAKVASDFKKPAGITVVKPEEAKAFLEKLTVIKIPYIGPKTELRLKQLGIRTVGELSSRTKEFLVSEFGKHGIYLHEAANGIDEEEVEESHEIKSINRNITFEEDTTDTEFMHNAIGEMAGEISNALIEDGLMCRTIGIRVRYSNFETFTRAKTMKEYGSSREKIIETAQKLLEQFLTGRMIRQLGVRVSNLADANISDEKEKQRTVKDFLL